MCALRASALAFICAFVFILAGCTGQTESPELKGTAIEYTVVEDEDLPEKLKELIDSRKEHEFRLTFTTNEYMYMTVGYGTMDTDGYSIAVRGVTADGDVVYVGTSLYGPAQGEKVAGVSTTPYIVIKTEKRGDSVVYK